MPTSRHSTGRFLDLGEVAAELNTSQAQVYALVRTGAIAALKLGGRGQWRVERTALEAYIETATRQTAEWIRNNPPAGSGRLGEAVQ